MQHFFLPFLPLVLLRLKMLWQGHHLGIIGYPPSVCCVFLKSFTLSFFSLPSLLHKGLTRSPMSHSLIGLHEDSLKGLYWEHLLLGETLLLCVIHHKWAQAEFQGPWWAGKKRRNPAAWPLSTALVSHFWGEGDNKSIPPGEMLEGWPPAAAVTRLPQAVCCEVSLAPRAWPPLVWVSWARWHSHYYWPR